MLAICTRALSNCCNHFRGVREILRSFCFAAELCRFQSNFSITNGWHRFARMTLSSKGRKIGKNHVWVIQQCSVGRTSLRLPGKCSRSVIKFLSIPLQAGLMTPMLVIFQMSLTSSYHDWHMPRLSSTCRQIESRVSQWCRYVQICFVSEGKQLARTKSGSSSNAPLEWTSFRMPRKCNC